MKIYAIYCDNGMDWEDHDNSIEPNHIYTDKEKADEICKQLNTPVFTVMSEEKFNEEGYAEGGWTYKEFVAYEKEQFDNPYYKTTYSVVEYTVKT